MSSSQCTEAAPGDADWSALAATHYENFPVGSFLLPRAQRRDLHRIYAFARTADDLADEYQDARALADLRAALAAHLDGGADPRQPMLHDLVATVRERDLPPELLFSLLDAFTLDLEVKEHSRASLQDYCTKSADPVGRLVLRVFGHDDPALDALSDKICTALQVINHLQDVGEDWRDRRRVYLPREDLAAAGVTTSDFEAASASPGLRRIVLDFADQAASSLAAGWPLTSSVRGRLAVELRAIVRAGARVIGHLRRIEGDVLAEHIRLRRRDKLNILTGALCSRSLPRDLV